MKYVFWISLLLIAYNYFIYPIFITLLSFVKKKAHVKEEITPTVSMVIAAYNEEKVIGGKLDNSLSLDYPKGNLEIIVVSDGSNDKTSEIVESYSDKGVISLHNPERAGKTAALNRGVARAKGEIIVFSDANPMYNSEAIKKLVRNFADPTVGGVTGLKSILKKDDRASSEGDSLYWKYESFIKIKESAVGSITTADGEIFAIRKDLFRPVETYLINDDTAITFNIIRVKKRVVYEPEAVSTELASIQLKDDFGVKVRMVAGGFQSVLYFFWDLFPPTTFFAFEFLSHKLIRWLVPVFMITLFVSNVFISKPVYTIFLAGQIIFYLSAGLGYLILNSGKNPGAFYFPLYFCVMNLAALMGLLKFVSGKHSITKVWKKAER